MSDDHEIVPVDAEIVSRESRDPITSVAMKILGNDPDAETVHKVLDFIERSRAIHARDSYIAAMSEVKRELPVTITRNRAGQHAGISYASLDHIMNEVKPALDAHGFDVSWQTKTTDRGIVIACRISHIGGHVEESETPPMPADKGPGRSAVQAVGSTMTYGARYSLLLALGLVAGNAPDPDEPRREPDPEKIDLNRNMAAATKLERRGLLYAAEEEIGRSSKDWTEADLAHLWTWAKEQKDQ